MIRARNHPGTGSIFAVLTGDLIGSTNLRVEALEQARSVLLGAVRDVESRQHGLVVGEAEFFRGDSWQVLLSDPRAFLRTALYLRAALRRERRGTDTRIAVGLGTVEKIEPFRISLSIGDAFVASGKQLDEMGDAVGITIDAPLGRLGWLVPLTALCSATMNGWSERQADIAMRMLLPGNPTQAHIAADLAVTRQAVSKALGSIEFGALLGAIRWVEEGDWPVDLSRRRARVI